MKQRRFLFILLVTAAFFACNDNNKAIAQNNTLKQLSQEKKDELGELLNLTKDINEARDLIKKGANVNYITSAGMITGFPLYSAAYRNDVAMAKLLLENGANADNHASNGATSLMWAAFNGSIDVAELLISYGADVNAKGKAGITPLMFAAQENQLAVAELLIKNGADVNLKDNENNTAMMYAKKEGFFEMVKLLKAAGAKE